MTEILNYIGITELFRNIINWLINHLIGIMIAVAIIYIVFGFYFKGLWSSTAAAWVGDISVFIAILQLTQQHKDSVNQLEFEKQKQKSKAEVFVNYVREEKDKKYIECSLVNIGYEVGIYKFVGVYPLNKLKEAKGVIDKIEIYRVVNQATFLKSIRGDSIRDFDTIARAETLGPIGISPITTNGINYIEKGEMMVAMFQDIEDRLYYKTFRYDENTDSLERGDKTEMLKMKR